jgi:hypothetical protein
MFMPVNYNVGLAGQSSVQLGGNKGTGSYAVGVGMDVHSQYRFDLKYVNNFGDFDTCGSAGNAANHGDGAAPGANGQYNCVPARPLRLPEPWPSSRIAAWSLSLSKPPSDPSAVC